jgi:hypothetical protein
VEIKRGAMNPTRKRANAFDDFPVEESAQPAGKVRQPIQNTSPAASAFPAMERIERLTPSQMIPDRFQPRHLLPQSLRLVFFSGQIDCYQAASEWYALAQSDASYRNEVDSLLAMGASYQEHGQIKPVTGAWTTLTDGRYIFQIETGERRFWAACLHAIANHLTEEPLLRVEVVAHPSRQRQVLENRHAEPPSAVGQACETAALILAELGVQPDPGSDDEYDYFRQVNERRMPAGLWSRIMPIMQLTRPRMVQLLNILHLPTPLLELADRHRMPERVLREVLALPPAERQAMLQDAILHGMTADEVAELNAMEPAQTGKAERQSPAAPQPGRIALGGLRRFTTALRQFDRLGQQRLLDQLADDLLVSRQAEDLLPLLDELGSLLRARLKRKQ